MFGSQSRNFGFVIIKIFFCVSSGLFVSFYFVFGGHASRRQLNTMYIALGYLSDRKELWAEVIVRLINVKTLVVTE